MLTFSSADNFQTNIVLFSFMVGSRNYDSFAGPIGKLFVSCEKLTIVKFEPTANFNWDIEPS